MNMQHQSDNLMSSQMIMYTPSKFSLTIEPIKFNKSLTCSPMSFQHVSFWCLL
jgi:hypothetical protein